MTRSEVIEAMARAYDREEAAQMGEPSPWSIADRDPEWESGRFACAEAALSAIEQSGLVVVPVEPNNDMCVNGGLKLERMMFEGDPDWTGVIFTDCGTVYRTMIAIGRLK